MKNIMIRPHPASNTQLHERDQRNKGLYFAVAGESEVWFGSGHLSFVELLNLDIEFRGKLPMDARIDLKPIPANSNNLIKPALLLQNIFIKPPLKNPPHPLPRIPPQNLHHPPRLNPAQQPFKQTSIQPRPFYQRTNIRKTLMRRIRDINP